MASDSSNACVQHVLPFAGSSDLVSFELERRINVKRGVPSWLSHTNGFQHNFPSRLWTPHRANFV
jgi:hypothetical protein